MEMPIYLQPLKPLLSSKHLNMHRILIIVVSSVGILSRSVYSYPKFAVQLRMWIPLHY
jgi:hypothetical protein